MESDPDPRPPDMEAECPPPPSPDQAPSQQVSRRMARPGFPNLLSIPLELQRTIASNLDVSDLGNLRATCKQLECGLYELYVQTLREARSSLRLASIMDRRMPIVLPPGMFPEDLPVRRYPQAGTLVAPPPPPPYVPPPPADEHPGQRVLHYIDQ
ncbi:uncharacterized protein J3D65DRAFT_656110 [Phyllosticta citribraziliensis]|uniref:F-box domain-containing protein n=1 Tax=Phyllosticta citribraziliensis TaxID=989973 RepID=A0ABR1M5H3_9PEZI